jgi:hypothetical protein
MFQQSANIGRSVPHKVAIALRCVAVSTGLISIQDTEGYQGIEEVASRPFVNAGPHGQRFTVCTGTSDIITIPPSGGCGVPLSIFLSATDAS